MDVEDEEIAENKGNPKRRRIAMGVANVPIPGVSIQLPIITSTDDVVKLPMCIEHPRSVTSVRTRGAEENENLDMMQDNENRELIPKMEPPNNRQDTNINMVDSRTDPRQMPPLLPERTENNDLEGKSEPATTYQQTFTLADRTPAKIGSKIPEKDLKALIKFNKEENKIRLTQRSGRRKGRANADGKKFVYLQYYCATKFRKSRSKSTDPKRARKRACITNEKEHDCFCHVGFKKEESETEWTIYKLNPSHSHHGPLPEDSP